MIIISSIISSINTGIIRVIAAFFLLFSCTAGLPVPRVGTQFHTLLLLVAEVTSLNSQVAPRLLIFQGLGFLAEVISLG